MDARNVWSDWPPGDSGLFWIVWNGQATISFRDSGPAGLLWEIGNERLAEIDVMGNAKFGPAIPSAEALANGVLIPRSDLSRIAAVLSEENMNKLLEIVSEIGVYNACDEYDRVNSLAAAAKSYLDEIAACRALLPPVGVETKGGA